MNDRNTDEIIPTPEQVRAWLRNHVCVPIKGIPKSFIDGLTKKVEKEE